MEHIPSRVCAGRIPFWNHTWNTVREWIQPNISCEDPPGYRIERCSTVEHCKDVQRFLFAEFGRPPSSPRLELPLTLSNNEWIYVMRSIQDHAIVGTLRYHLAGHLVHDGTRIDLVDAFCMAASVRGKGLGAYLLHRLHRDANAAGRPCALFLKEGAGLHPWAIQPLLQGQYVYCDVTKHRIHQEEENTRIPAELAHRLLQVYARLNPDRLILRPATTANQLWLRVGPILCCIQDTYQRKERHRMAWITTWLEPSGCSVWNRRQAMNAAIHCAATAGFTYLWVNRAWIHADDLYWHVDGSFSWYAFQWSPRSTCYSYGLTY